MRPWRILLATISVVPATGARGAELYVGGSASTSMESRVARDDQKPDGDFGFDVRAGVEASILGVEVAWHDLGDVTWCRECADAGGGASTKMWSAGVTAGKTLGRVRPFVKLGWFHALTDGSEQTFAGPRAFERSEDGIFGEAGLRAFLGRHLVLRAGYERFDFDVNDDGGVTLGAELRF